MGLLWPQNWAIEMMEMDPLLIEDANNWDKIYLSDNMGIAIYPFLKILTRVQRVEFVREQDFLDHISCLEYASSAAVLQVPIGSPFVSLWVCAQYIRQK